MKENVVYVQGLEKAIKERYGVRTVTNPNSNWNDEREKDYIRQLQERKEVQVDNVREKTDAGGFLVRRKLVNSKEERNCPICNKYSFEIKDDVYINKFFCCYGCFVQYVEGREERWKNGWRPK